MMNPLNFICECDDCADNPCSQDCPRDEECSGCRLSRERAEEEEFDTKCAQGHI